MSALPRIKLVEHRLHQANTRRLSAVERAHARWGIRAGIQQALLDSASFLPVTHTFNSGSAATETVPAGASFLTITVFGGGGSGSAGNGGGGGAQAISTRIIVIGGQTLTYTVGAGGPLGGNPGTPSGVIGNGALSAISMTANGGGAGTAGGVGAGGTASGGNSANNSGQAGSGTNGGNNGAGTNGGSPGGGNPGGGSDGSSASPGGSGQIIFAYT